MTRNIKKWGKGVLSVILVSLITIELISIAVIELRLIGADKPNYLIPGIRPFWVNKNPDFGGWHEPDVEYVHTKSCFSVTYKTNA